MSTAHAIFRSYHAPRVVARSFQDAGADEGTGLGWLFAACGLFFVAQLPELARVAHLSDGETPLFALGLGTFFGTLLLAPILFYVLATLSGYVARVFGWSGSLTDARLTLFWGLLAAAPVMLVQGLISGFVGAGIQATIVSLLAFVLFLWVWINGLIALGSRTG